MSTIENQAAENPVTQPKPINRLGQFKVSAALLRGGAGWPALLPLFAHMVVIRAEFIFASDAIEYMAHSDLFEESPEHCVPPEYDIIGNTKPDGSVEYSVKKILSLADIQLKPK